MGVEIKFASSRDIQNDDASGYDRFKDISLNSKVPVRIGAVQLQANVKMAGWGGGPLYAVLYDATTTAVRIEGLWLFGVQGPSGRTEYSHRINSYLVGASGQGSAPGQNWFNMPMAPVEKCTVGGGQLVIDFENAASTTTITDSTDHLFYSLPYFLVV